VVSFAIQARDVEDDPLTFSATNLPSGLAINPMTGVISGTIDFTAIVRSPYSVTVTVSDGTASTNTTFTWTITILHDPGTTVVGRVIDAGGKPVAGASVICLGLKGLTGADGTFSLAGVPTVQGNIQCSVNVFTPPGQTLTGTVMGVTPLRGQITNVGDITVTPLALFGTDASGGNLLTINPATGIGTIVGPMRVGSVPALAIDPTTDIMYAATGSGNPNLYMVDPSTGATSLIGSTGLGVAAVSDIAFRADGTLYAAVNIVGDGSTGADNLATINKTTGQATVIEPFDGLCTQSPCTIEGMEAIAFDPAGNLLGALSERGAAGLPGLYKINPTTGLATFFAPILDVNGTSLSGGVVSLQFCDGILFGGTARAIPTSATDGGRLIIIAPATGLFTFAGAGSAPSGSSLGALACQ
jgi:hypothetical protein